MAGYKYQWKCPNCGTSIQLKMRVTQTKRKCPHCGTLVTSEEIDKQASMNAVGGLIASLTIVAAILLCCKGCPDNSARSPHESSTPAPTVSETTISTATNSAMNLTPVPPKREEAEGSISSIDLSNPKDAFLAHIKAMKNRDVDRYVETISQKNIKDEFSGVLGKDANGKKRNSIKEIAAYWFSIWSCRVCTPPDIVKYGFELVGNPQIRGTKATVWYRDNGTGNTMVARLTKEGNNWKVDTYKDYPKRWEEKEFFKNTDLGNRL